MVVLLINGHNNIFLLEDIELIGPFTNAIKSVFGAGETCQYGVGGVKICDRDNLHLRGEFLVEERAEKVYLAG